MRTFIALILTLIALTIPACSPKTRILQPACPPDTTAAPDTTECPDEDERERPRGWR